MSQIIHQGQDKATTKKNWKAQLRAKGIGNKLRYNDHSRPNDGLLATTSCGDVPLHVALGLRAVLHFVGSTQQLGKLTIVGSVVFFINVSTLKTIKSG